MAEPISSASGVVALVGFSMQAGKSLYTLIERFSQHTRIVRDLKTDLKALDEVLKELSEVADKDVVAQFSSLKLPLHSCGQICQEFDALIQKCARKTTETHRSFGDWSKLQLRSDDINTFRITLSGYKSTIQVALGGINLRTSQVTLECIQDYRSLIRDTKADLKEQLDRIEAHFPEKSSTFSSSDYLQWITSQDRVEEEKQTIVRCLEICEEVSKHINSRQSAMFEDIAAAAGAHQDSVSTDQAPVLPSDKLTSSSLRECREKLASAMKELNERLSSIGGDTGSPELLEDERLRRCLALCDECLTVASRARICSYEDVAADESSRQYIVSTFGDLISAKRITAGARSVMVLGQMSDESLQISFQNLGSTVSGADGSSSPKTSPPASFGSYGAGHRLNNPTRPK